MSITSKKLYFILLNSFVSSIIKFYQKYLSKLIKPDLIIIIMRIQIDF